MVVVESSIFIFAFNILDSEKFEFLNFQHIMYEFCIGCIFEFFN